MRLKLIKRNDSIFFSIFVHPGTYKGITGIYFSSEYGNIYRIHNSEDIGFETHYSKENKTFHI